MPLKLQLSFNEGLRAAELPLSRSELARLFRGLAQMLWSTPEGAETIKKLGGRPRLVNLLITNDVQMRDFQKRFRKLDRTTDILSFPTREWPNVAAAMERLPLGDLVVSLPAVARGAVRGRRSLRSELVEVLVHGCLHLVGFDHVVGKAAAVRMRAVQKKLFSSALKIIKSR